MVQCNWKKDRKVCFIVENKKSTGKTVAIIILVLLVLGLGGYIAYDKVIVKESRETEEPIKTEKKVVDNSTSTQEETTADYVGAYSGTAEVPAEIGRPTETNELLIKDEKNATFCFNIGTGTSCYKGTYLIKDKVLYLHSTEKQILDGTSSSDMKVTESGNDNSYMTFVIEESKIVYNGEASGSLLGDLTKIDNNNLKYANKF